MRLKNYLTEGYLPGGKTLNVAKVPLEKARDYMEKIVKKPLPNFDKNYVKLQNVYKKDALDIPRIQMPVIEPTDMAKFNERLQKGQIDIFKPFSKESIKKQKFPTDMNKKEGELWVQLGIKDGNPNDDKIPAKVTQLPAHQLKPLQGQLWLEKLIGGIHKFGPPKAGSPVLKTTIIVSKEGYILDGHHRHGQVMLTDPKLKIQALFVPLDIKTLLKMGKSYGAAIGNKPKA